MLSCVCLFVPVMTQVGNQAGVTVPGPLHQPSTSTAWSHPLCNLEPGPARRQPAVNTRMTSNTHTLRRLSVNSNIMSCLIFLPELFVCLFVYLSIHPFVRLSGCLFVHLFDLLSVWRGRWSSKCFLCHYLYLLKRCALLLYQFSRLVGIKNVV